MNRGERTNLRRGFHFESFLRQERGEESFISEEEKNQYET
jgi:hypothetical protein